MKDRYHLVSLKDCGVELIDCVHKTPKACKSGYPYISIPDMKDGRVLLDNSRLISEIDMNDWNAKCNPIPGDVILSRRCNPGVTAVIPDGFQGTLGQNLVLLRSSDKGIDQNYLRWAVKSKQWWNEVNRYINVGAIFESLRCADIPKFEIPLPSQIEQKAIANILGTLDEKIELNKKTNETLEDISKALFKSWFINFDPVIAKEDMSSEVFPDKINQLFQNSLSNNEFGKIPKGWKICKLKNIFEIKKGSTPSTRNEENWHPGIFEWVSPRDLSKSNSIYFSSARKISEAGLKKIKSGLCPIGTILISSRAPIGLMGISSGDVSLGTGIFGILPDKNISSGLIYLYLKNIIKNLKQLSIGTTFEEISLKIFSDYEIIFPDEEFLYNTKNIFDSIFEKIKVNSSEIKTLSKLKDTLLPKLISGELRITDAEKMIDEVGI